MNKIKKIVTVTLSIFILLLICGCGNTVEYKDAENPISEKLANEATVVESGIVADNDRFSLIWDNENVCIQLLNKVTGEKWSSTPCNSDGSYIDDPENRFSPIDIEYVLYSGYKTVESIGKKDVIDNGFVSAKKISNGIEVIFIFSEHKIAIPVNFLLNENGLQASVELEDIVEDLRDRKVFNITLLPYFCSADNSKENYLFVPSGSGSLMYTDERNNEVPREFKDKVYGEDPTQEIQEKFTSQANICMPVYGVKKGESTISAIITSGAEKSYIKAYAGNAAIKCSYICNSFQIRGYNGSILEYGGVTGKKLVGQYTREMDDNSIISVQYTPATSESQGYTFIANEYRKHLVDKYELTETDEESIASFKIFGGIQVKKHMFGIPYSKVEALTTFDETKKIITKLNNFLNNFDVQLVGFGENGIDVGKLGGGFTYSNELGDKNSIAQLQKYCSEKTINLYYDYDLIRFNKSDNGFSPSSDNSITANEYPAKIYEYSPVTGAMDEEGAVSAILNRSKVQSAVNKAILANKDIGFKGISLSSWSNISYSDYSKKMMYSNGALIDKEFTTFSKIIRENDLKLASNAANDYAAVLSAKIFDAPSNDAMSLSFDCTVPFYQIVYKGYINHSLDSVNTAANSRKQILKSIETGSVLQFSLIEDYKSEYAFYNHKNLQLMVFENNIDTIKNALNECGEYLESVKNSTITDHTIINTNVRKTVFDNGVTVYVNYGNTDYTDGEISVKPMDFEVR